MCCQYVNAIHSQYIHIFAYVSTVNKDTKVVPYFIWIMILLISSKEIVKVKIRDSVNVDVSTSDAV